MVFGSNKTSAWGAGTLNLTTLADGQRGFMLLGQAGDRVAPPSVVLGISMGMAWMIF